VETLKSLLWRVAAAAAGAKVLPMETVRVAAVLANTILGRLIFPLERHSLPLVLVEPDRPVLHPGAQMEKTAFSQPLRVSVVEAEARITTMT